MADTLKVGALSMRAVCITIARGMEAQRNAGNDFSTRADKAVARGLARPVRGMPGLYRLTSEGEALLERQIGSEL